MIDKNALFTEQRPNPETAKKETNTVVIQKAWQEVEGRLTVEKKVAEGDDPERVIVQAESDIHKLFLKTGKEVSFQMKLDWDFSLYRPLNSNSLNLVTIDNKEVAHRSYIAVSYLSVPQLQFVTIVDVSSAFEL